MSAARATPRPWEFMTPSMGFSAIHGPNGELIFGTAAGSPGEKQSDEICEANWRFMERACNAHEDLVAALNHLAAAVAEMAGRGVELPDDVEEAIDDAGAALAKAHAP